MKPYYSESGITIYHGDCREVAPLLARVDLVLTDPPYGMDWNTDTDRFSGGGIVRDKRRTKHTPIIGDKEPFNPAPWLEFKKVILWGSNHYAQKLPVGTTLVWIKRHPELFASFLSDCEIGWMKGGHGVRAFYKQFPPPVRAIEADGDPCVPKTTHPSQKPLGLMAWCMAMAADASVILDPYMGSGTTLRAAKDLGRQAIGIEIEERYCEIAAKRLAQEVFAL